MTYIQKNKYRIMLIMGTLIVASLSIAFLLQKRLFHSVTDIDCKVYPLMLAIGDVLFYADKSSFSALKKWEFGDGNISVIDSGCYLYNGPGF